jgi:hypothetical protein
MVLVKLKEKRHPKMSWCGIMHHQLMSVCPRQSIPFHEFSAGRAITE